MSATPSRITALTVAVSALGLFAAAASQVRAAAPAAPAAPAASAASASAHRAAHDILIDGRNVYPESLSAAPDGTLYIGSVTGAVYRAEPGSTRAEPWIRADAANGLGSVFGVLADPKSRTLWVCSTPSPLNPHAKGGTTALVAFDLATRARKGFYPFPPPKATCNDITVGPDGTAYATDTPNGRILELPRGAHALEVFAHDTRLKGVDGIAFSGDDVLYGDLVTSNQLIRIDRKPDGRFAGITPLASSRKLGAPDGLRLIAGNRFVLAEGGAGRIDEVSIDGNRAAITVLRSGFMSPPGVTFVPGIRAVRAARSAAGTAYAVDGKIGYLIDPHLKGKNPGPFMAYAIPLPTHHR